jgi:hypothetical protein
MISSQSFCQSLATRPCPAQNVRHQPFRAGYPSSIDRACPAQTVLSLVFETVNTTLTQPAFITFDHYHETLLLVNIQWRS